ncbi:MAG: tetratricopeptide repeat protein [Burkholderiales bacterium]
MKCNACGTETAIAGKFCPQCGAAVLPDGPLNIPKPAAPASGKGGYIAAAVAAVALAGGGSYVYYDKQQQEKARVVAERVAEEKRQADIAERDKKLAEERAAREREATARIAAEKQAKVLAQQKADADARVRAAEDNAKKASIAAAAAAKAVPPPSRPGAVLTTERSAPLIRAMVSAAIAGDEGGIQRYRQNIEALPKPAPGDRVAAGAARQTASEAFKRGDTQMALDRYQYAISIDPTDIGAYSGLGQVFNRLGRYAEADAAFSRALTLAPASSAAWTNFGLAIARSGNTNNAAGALVNSFVFAADRRRAYESLQRLEKNRDGNVSAAASRALQSRLVAGVR